MTKTWEVLDLRPEGWLKFSGKVSAVVLQEESVLEFSFLPNTGPAADLHVSL